MNWQGLAKPLRIKSPSANEFTDQSYYLITNKSNNAIMCATHVYEVATALLLRFPVLGITAIKPGLPGNNFLHTDNSIHNINLLENNFYFTPSKPLLKSEQLGTLSANKVTDGHIAMRKDLIECKNFLELCFQYISEVTTAETDALNGMVVRYYDTILHEYNRCDPDADYYTDGFTNYASFTGAPSLKDAYDALGREIQTINTSRLRAVGLWDWLLRNFSKYKSNDELIELKQQLATMIFGGSKND